MQNRIKKEYNLRTSDFDKNGNIHLSSVLDIFQDIAGIHSEILGVSINDLLKQNKVWMILKSKFEIIKQPKMHSTVYAETWPLTPRKAFYIRDYLIMDQDGEILIKGTSQWVIVDIESRKALMNPEITYPLETYCEERSMEPKFAKIGSFESDNSILLKPSYSDVDVNGHINNSKYANYIYNALYPNVNQISKFQIEYHKEILPKQEIYVFCSEETEGQYKVKGLNANNELMFAALIN